MRDPESGDKIIKVKKLIELLGQLPVDSLIRTTTLGNTGDLVVHLPDKPVAIGLINITQECFEAW